MKYLKLYFVLLFCLLSADGFCQTNAIEQWYSPVRNKFLIIIIKSDSIFFAKQPFDFSDSLSYSREGLFKIETKAKNGNGYVVSETGYIDPSDNHGDQMTETGWVTRYRIISFFEDVERKMKCLSIESIDSNFTNKEDAQKYLNSHDFEKYGVLLYSRNDLPILHKKKNAETITKEDFVSYVKTLGELTGSIKLRKKKYKMQYVFSESLSRMVLSDLGYNPLIKGNVMDRVIEKFASDKEIEALIKNIPKRD